MQDKINIAQTSETVKPLRVVLRERAQAYDDDDLQGTDQFNDINTRTPPHPTPSSSYECPQPSIPSYHALHARAWRGLQALGFRDVPQVIAKHTAARVVLGLNWVESNPYPKNRGGLLRRLLDSGDPIPPPLPSNDRSNRFSKYRHLIRRGYCIEGLNEHCGECADCLAEEGAKA